MLDGLDSPTYELSPKTMAVVAIHNENGTVNTRVLEERTQYDTQIPPTKMIENACRYFGSSFQGSMLMVYINK